MKIRSHKFYSTLAVLATWLAGNGLDAQVLTNMAGTWNGISFNVPSQLTSVYQQGLVVDLLENNAFGANAFQVNAQSDGTFSGPNGNGTVSVNGQGAFTVYPDGAPSISFRVNFAQDAFAGIGSDSNGSGSENALNLVAKTPATLATNDVTGSWSLMTFATPQRLVEVLAPTTNSSALTDLLGFDSNSVSSTSFSEIESGSLTINSNGTFSGALPDPFTGTYSFSGVGQINLNINTGQGTLLLTNFINASKDVMFGLNLENSGNRQEIVMLTKNPANVVPADLQGVWKVTSFRVPTQIGLLRNSSNFITSVTQSEDFSMEQSSFTVGHDGFVTAVFDGQPFLGGVTIGTGGAITLAFTNGLGQAQSHTGHINAGKNYIALVESDGSGSEITIVTRAPDYPSATGQDFGMLHFNGMIYWASGTNRVLQTAASLGASWTNLPLTQGQHQFQPGFTNSAGFYRVATQ